MPYYNCCVSGCTNNFRNVGKLPCPSKQATRPSALLDWEMANSLVSIWLYDFLANKIDWLKQDFCKYRRKGAF
jgi:hypothetical protein